MVVMKWIWVSQFLYASGVSWSLGECCSSISQVVVVSVCRQGVVLCQVVASFQGVSTCSYVLISGTPFFLGYCLLRKCFQLLYHGTVAAFIVLVVSLGFRGTVALPSGRLMLSNQHVQLLLRRMRMQQQLYKQQKVHDMLRKFLALEHPVLSLDSKLELFWYL